MENRFSHRFGQTLPVTNTFINLTAENTGGNANFGINYEPLLDMKTMTRKMAWNIVLLFGGGMAIAEGCQVFVQIFFT